MPIKRRIVGMGETTVLANVEVGTVSNTLTAAGTTQGTATTLLNEDNHVFTTVASGTGAVIQADYFATGDCIRVSNYGANALKLYPASGGAISNGSVNAAISIAVGGQANLYCIDGLNWSAINALGGSTASTTAGIVFRMDGGGAVITTGVKEYVQIPFACTITQATQVADQTGSLVTNIYKCTYSQFDAGATHPVVGDKITSSTPPTISSTYKSQDSTLTGWTTAIAANDILAFVIDSCTTITKVDLTLRVTK